MTIDTTSFSEEVLDQASAWIVRLRSDHVTEQDQQDFALWLSSSEQHQLAFDEIMVLWEAMGSAAVKKPSSSVSALLGKVSIDDGPRASNDCHAHPNTQTISAHQPKHTRRNLIAGLGAMAASVFILGGIFLNQSPSSPSTTVTPTQSLFVTTIGKQQRFILEDGSTLELNTDSKVSVQFEKGSRNLHLIQGEAYFDVVSDPNRPFTVTAGKGQVTAVGTAFNMQLDSENDLNQLFVAVTEGKVLVAKAGDNTSNATGVGIGFQTQVNNEGLVGQVKPADIEQVKAWREKTLIFRETNLVTALGELNRYLMSPVDLTDPSLQTLNISGTFSLEEPETTLSAIIDAFDLESYKSPFDNKTRLYRR